MFGRNIEIKVVFIVWIADVSAKAHCREVELCFVDASVFLFNRQRERLAEVPRRNV